MKASFDCVAPPILIKFTQMPGNKKKNGQLEAFKTHLGTLELVLCKKARKVQIQTVKTTTTKLMKILPQQVFQSQCYLYFRKLWTDLANSNGLNKNIKLHQAMREAKPYKWILYFCP